MDYVKKFSSYCDTITNSKIIEIPDKGLAQTVRRQEFTLSCKAMKSYFNDAFSKEIESIDEQSYEENKPLTVEQKKEMNKIKDSKIKVFIEKADDKFSE